MAAVGLVPVMALADRAGFSDLVGEHVALAKPGGCNAPVKNSTLVAAMGVKAQLRRRGPAAQSVQRLERRTRAVDGPNG